MLPSILSCTPALRPPGQEHRPSNGDKSTDANAAMHCGLRYGFMLTGSWWPHAQESKYTCFMPVILMVCNTMSNLQLCAPGGFVKRHDQVMLALPHGQLKCEHNMDQRLHAFCFLSRRCQPTGQVSHQHPESAGEARMNPCWLTHNHDNPKQTPPTLRP